MDMAESLPFEPRLGLGMYPRMGMGMGMGMGLTSSDLWESLQELL